jgi:hypothetical protein
MSFFEDTKQENKNNVEISSVNFVSMLSLWEKLSFVTWFVLVRNVFDIRKEQGSFGSMARGKGKIAVHSERVDLWELIL